MDGIGLGVYGFSVVLRDRGCNVERGGTRRLQEVVGGQRLPEGRVIQGRDGIGLGVYGGSGGVRDRGCDVERGGT